MDIPDRVLEIMEEDIPLINDISSFESSQLVKLETELSIDSSGSISPTVSVPVVTPTPKRKSIIFFLHYYLYFKLINLSIM